MDSPQAKILEHRRDPDGCYRMLVHTDVSKTQEDGSPDPSFLREFTWGPIPIVPSAATDSEAYAEVHDRLLVPGEDFVSEDEYLYLQVAEAMETVVLEREQAVAKPVQFEHAEGVTF